jgi:hypothetical protein
MDGISSMGYYLFLLYLSFLIQKYVHNVEKQKAQGRCDARNHQANYLVIASLCRVL